MDALKERSKIDFKIFENENARILYYNGINQGKAPLHRIYLTEEMMLMWDVIGHEMESYFPNLDEEFLDEY